MRDQPTLTENAAEFLEEMRGIPVDIASQHCVTINGKIAFNFVHDGALQYLKIFTFDRTTGKRSPDQSPSRDRSGVATVLFNGDAIARESASKVLVVTEGEIDALSFLAAGLETVVSLPDGGIAKKEQGDIDPQQDDAFAFFYNEDRSGYIEGLGQYDKIVLAVDNDPKGRATRDALAVRLGRNRCYWPRWPEGCKDGNEVLLKHGTQAVVDLVTDAVPIVPDRWISLKDAVIEEYETYVTGVAGLDEHLILRPGGLGLITGPPSSGKSQLATIMAGQVAFQKGKRVAMICAEDTAERIQWDMATIVMREKGIRNRVDAVGAMGDMVKFIGADEAMDDEARNIAWLENVVREAAVRHNAELLIIDPWNELEHFFERQYSVAMYLNQALRRMTKLARQYQMAILIVAHPTNAANRMTNIDEWILNEVDGGAAWRNKLTWGVIVLRNQDNENETFIKVAKVRDQLRLGTPGTITSRFNRPNMSFDLVRMGGPELQAAGGAGQ